MIASILSVVIYYSVVSERRRALGMKMKMIVAGTIIGLYFIMTCVFFDTMDIKNPALRQTFVLSLVIFIFRTLEGK